MYAAVILIQILAVSVGGYVNFVLEGPCPEKYYGSQKCYTYSYRTNNPSRNIKRVYVKKPWENFDDVLEKNTMSNKEL